MMYGVFSDTVSFIWGLISKAIYIWFMALHVVHIPGFELSHERKHT